MITTDTTAAIAPGFSSNQTIALASPLVVPGQSTFYWNGQGSVTTVDGFPCGLQPGQPAFEEPRIGEVLRYLATRHQKRIRRQGA